MANACLVCFPTLEIKTNNAYIIKNQGFYLFLPNLITFLIIYDKGGKCFELTID